jgi:hypothetical protein
MLRAIWYAPGLVYAAMYAFLAVTASGHVPDKLADSLVIITLPSGATWNVTFGHVFVLGSMFLLFFELARLSTPSRSTVLEHSLAAISAVTFFGLFILVPDFGTTEFLLATLMSIFDFLAGAGSVI